VHSYRFFKKSLRHEISGARRSNLPLGLLLLEVEKFAEMSEPEQRNVNTVLIRIFVNALREVDIISNYNKESIFAIILPGQSKMDVQTITERLVQDVNSYKLRPFENRLEYLSLKTGFAVWEPQTGHYDNLILNAEKQLQTEEIKIIHELFDDIEYLRKKVEDDMTR
jgi:GGDEF domain-containing protein